MTNDDAGGPSILLGCVRGIAIIGFGFGIVVVAIYLILVVVLPILGIHLPPLGGV